MSFDVLTSIIVATTLFTGMTGLIYEVAWQRYLSNILGSQAHATAMILSVFLGGLAVGYAVFGRISRDKSQVQLLRLAATAEIAIGVWAFAFPLLYEQIWRYIGILPINGNLQFLAEIAVAIALIGLPTILMGSTLPLLTQGLAKSVGESSRLHSMIYSTNTFGAFFGCLIAGYFLIAMLGLPLTMMYTSFVNFLAGFIMFAVASSLHEHGNETRPGLPSNQVNPISTKLHHLNKALVLFLAFTSGFVALTTQTLLIRATGLAIGASEYSFALIVAVYVLMLALGARLTSKFQRWSAPHLLVVSLSFTFVSLFAVYFTFDSWSYFAYLVRIIFSNSTYAFYAYQFAICVAAMGVLAIPVGAMGMSMPLIFASTARENKTIGGTVGHIYTANTMGCVCGAYLGGYLLLYVIDLDQLMKIVLLILTVNIGLILYAVSLPQQFKLSSQGRKVSFVCCMTLVLAALIYNLPGWDKELMGFGFFRSPKESDNSYLGAKKAIKKLAQVGSLLSYDDDPNTTVSVYEQPLPKDAKPDDKPTRSLLVNGKSDGATGYMDLVTTKLLAHLPSLLMNSPNKRVGLVGYGTGITAGSLLTYEELSGLDVFEISSGVKAAARLFAAYNGDATKNPKLSWISSDAYRAIGSSENKYGLLVSEPSNPWVTGVEKVFSADFYQIVFAKLDDQGIYCQWFHSYSIDTPTYATVLRTFNSVFPHVRIFENGADIILIGSKQRLGIENIMIAKEKISRSAVREDLGTINSENLLSLLARERNNYPTLIAMGGLHTLDEPKLSYMAGRDLFHDRQFSYNKFLQDDILQAIIPLLDRQLLATLALKSNPPLIEFQNYAKQVCGRPLDKLGPWQDLKDQCLRVVAYLAEQPGWQGQQGDKLQIHARWMRSDSASIPRELDRLVGRKELLLSFFRVDWVVSPLNLQKARQLVTPCLVDNTKEGLVCTKLFTMILVSRGEFGEALTIIDRIAAAYPETMFIESGVADLKNYIRQNLITSSH